MAGRGVCIAKQEALTGELGVSERGVRPRLMLHSRWALSSPDGRIISKFTSIQINSVTASPRENSSMT